jgi:membrane protease YdiL (CAAX protease family)
MSIFLSNAQLGENSAGKFFLVVIVSFISIGTSPFTFLELFLGKSSWSHFLISNTPFFLALVIIFILIHRLHRYSWKTVITYHKHTQLRKFFLKIIFACFCWLLIKCAFTVPFYIMNPTKYTYNFRLAEFLPMLIVCMLTIPIQAAFEEVLFRGYMLQQLGLLCQRVWQPIVVTSVIFVILHISPNFKTNGIAFMTYYYILHGLMYSIIVLMDEGIILAIGVHTANNLFAALVVTQPNPFLDFNGLLSTSSSPLTLIDLFVQTVMSILIIFIFQYKYRQGSFRKLLAPIPQASVHGENPTPEIDSKNVASQELA